MKKSATSKFAAIAATAVTEPAIGPRRGRPPGKRSDPTYVPLTIYVPKALHSQMKAKLYGERREFSVFVAEAFAAALAADDAARPKSRKR